MHFSDLPLPEAFKQNIKDKGIEFLYPPQNECIEKGLLEGADLLVAIPTASGKTLIAEMAMHAAIARGGMSLYIVPLKALATEKAHEFANKGCAIGVATGDYDQKEARLGANDIVIATSEKVDSLLRNGAPWLSRVSCLVVDEVHLIDDESRGPTLEMVITKLRHATPNMQVIALSATIGNPKELAGWLGADLITSDWRPVDLREGICYRNMIYFNDEEREIPSPAKTEDINLLLDCVADGGQCLVFVSSRRNAEGYAKRAASALKSEHAVLDSIAEKLEAAAETDMGRTLAACVRNGAAFHHAGMNRMQRTLVEEGFRSGFIKSISSTPTLAAGLNLPARRVIIRDYLRYVGGEGMRPIPVREYRQMAGRAGRPHLDPYGEAILIAKSEYAVNDLYEEYVEAPDEEVRSGCGEQGILTAHILSLVATGFARSRDELMEFLEKTFYAHQHTGKRALSRTLNDALSFLTGAEMVTDLSGMLHATEYGELTSRLYIDPRSAEMITAALREDGELTDLALLQLLCMTPDMFTLYVKKNDLAMLEKFFYDHEEEFRTEFSYDEMEEFFRSLKTAMLLSDWMDETGDDTICTRYGVGPGDIHNAVEGIGWLLHASGRLARLFSPEHRNGVEETTLRIRHGIRHELIPLVRIKGIGRVRARRLFTNNITSPEALLTADPAFVGSIVGGKTAESIIRAAKTMKRGRGRRDPLAERMAARNGENEPTEKGQSGQNTGAAEDIATVGTEEGPGAQRSLFSFGGEADE
ncbi:ATP-dependent DNA helicase [Methanogenium organophilum]|uniref:ATP-dependent DNA helicase Hel308 n=1 Tax=Methanogenium organophilum TaxID=2199 RepID=A0A9X9T9V8_METOG|nr:ATP-dependent DNA helicase [Methanogenium organophilum]WAI02472.1 ATP-dependent DNA helicase [Methanogenium organophilum]